MIIQQRKQICIEYFNNKLLEHYCCKRHMSALVEQFIAALINTAVNLLWVCQFPIPHESYTVICFINPLLCNLPMGLRIFRCFHMT